MEKLKDQYHVLLGSYRDTECTLCR